VATVVAGLTMSLDGFIAHRDDSVQYLFDWYDNGEVEVSWPGNDMVSHVSHASAAYLHELIDGAGALVVGRRLFDYTNGWAGSHPIGVPVFLVTHTMPARWPRADAPFTIVLDGVESAIAQAKAVAGDKSVGVAGPNVIQQCLNLGLIDELHVELVPVLLGDGIRFFGDLAHSPVVLDDPTVIEGTHVTHLAYKVRRDGT
jgi:dihydrofolate reductase